MLIIVNIWLEDMHSVDNSTNNDPLILAALVNTLPYYRTVCIAHTLPRRHFVYLLQNTEIIAQYVVTDHTSLRSESSLFILLTAFSKKRKISYIWAKTKQNQITNNDDITYIHQHRSYSQQTTLKTKNHTSYRSQVPTGMIERTITLQLHTDGNIETRGVTVTCCDKTIPRKN